MKKIKKYNEFLNETLSYLDGISKNEMENLFKDRINWDLIEDLKDLSLEYIDKGATFKYDINCMCKYIYNKVFRYELDYISVIDGLFNHQKDEYKYDYINVKIDLKDIKTSKIVYKIALIIEYNDQDLPGFEYLIDETTELVDKINKIYPNEFVTFREIEWDDDEF